MRHLEQTIKRFPNGELLLAPGRSGDVGYSSCASCERRFSSLTRLEIENGIAVDVSKLLPHGLLNEQAKCYAVGTAHCFVAADPGDAELCYASPWQLHHNHGVSNLFNLRSVGEFLQELASSDKVIVRDKLAHLKSIVQTEYYDFRYATPSSNEFEIVFSRINFQPLIERIRRPAPSDGEVVCFGTERQGFVLERRAGTPMRLHSSSPVVQSAWSSTRNIVSSDSSVENFTNELSARGYNIAFEGKRNDHLVVSPIPRWLARNAGSWYVKSSFSAGGTSIVRVESANQILTDVDSPSKDWKSHVNEIEGLLGRAPMPFELLSSALTPGIGCFTIISPIVEREIPIAVVDAHRYEFRCVFRRSPERTVVAIIAKKSANRMAANLSLGGEWATVEEAVAQLTTHCSLLDRPEKLLSRLEATTEEIANALQWETGCVDLGPVVDCKRNSIDYAVVEAQRVFSVTGCGKVAPKFASDVRRMNL